MLQCGSFSFPIHISHVMQPFDLAVAAPLKSQLKISISNGKINIEKLDFKSFDIIIERSFSF